MDLSGRPISATRWNRADTCSIAALLLLTLVPYAQVAWFDFVVLDDLQYVVQSDLTRRGLDPLALLLAVTDFHADNWHPLVWWSLMLDWQLFGPNPAAYHLVNLAWHLANVALLYVVLLELTADRGRSLLIAGVFAIHPLHVESVAWISERKDVLSGFFWMLGLWCYARWGRTSWPGWWWGVTACLACGLMSKQILVTLPLVCLLLDFWPLRRWQTQPEHGIFGGLPWKLIWEKLPWFALCGGASVMAILAQRSAQVAAGDWPLSLRLANATLSLARYLAMAFWPVNLSVQYPLDPPESLGHVALAGLLLAMLTTLAIWWGRRQPAVLVGWLWFVITLLPVIGLIQVGKQSLADRYMYLPLIGLTLSLAWLIPPPRARWQCVTAIALLSGITVALLVRTTQQTTVWRNSETLFEHALRVNPTNDSALYALGWRDLQAGQIDRGLDYLHQAIDWDRRRWHARRHFGGDPDPRQTVESNSRWAETYFGLGQAELQRGRPEAAIADYREALRLDADHVESHLALGMLLTDRGQFREALVEFETVLQRHPHNQPAAAARDFVASQLPAVATPP